MYLIENKNKMYMLLEIYDYARQSYARISKLLTDSCFVLNVGHMHPNL